MKLLKRTILVLALLCGLAMPAAPVYAAFDPFGDACKNTSGAKDSLACQQNGSDTITGDAGVLAKVTQVIAWLAGAASVILIVISGFMYVTSNGDSSKLNGAKETIIYAVVGLVIVLVAQGIIIFVINKV